MCAEFWHYLSTFITVALLGLLYYILFVPVTWKDVNNKNFITAQFPVKIFFFIDLSRMTQVIKNQL